MRNRALTLFGGLLLLSGLVIALIANHYEAGVIGTASPGALWTEAEWLFWIGLGLTGAGVVLQTVGALLEE